MEDGERCSVERRKISAMMRGDICGDDRFEIIEQAKKALLESTNIKDRPNEMEVLDSLLFRCWQMGWLDCFKSGRYAIIDYGAGHKSKVEVLAVAKDVNLDCGGCSTTEDDWILILREKNTGKISSHPKSVTKIEFVSKEKYDDHSLDF